MPPCEGFIAMEPAKGTIVVLTGRFSAHSAASAWQAPPPAATSAAVLPQARIDLRAV